MTPQANDKGRETVQRCLCRQPAAATLAVNTIYTVSAGQLTALRAIRERDLVRVQQLSMSDSGLAQMPQGLHHARM